MLKLNQGHIAVVEGVHSSEGQKKYLGVEWQNILVVG